MKYRMLTIVLAGCFVFGTAVCAAAPEEPPPPDYDAIRSAAQKSDPDKDYVDVLPERLGECKDTARPYNRTGITSAMVESKFLLMLCLEAMMAMMAELYFERDAFGPGGIGARLDEVAKPLFTIFEDTMTKATDCEGRPCGSIFEQIAPRDQYLKFLHGMIEFMVLRIYGYQITPAWERWRDAWRAAY